MDAQEGGDRCKVFGFIEIEDSSLRFPSGTTLASNPA
jgi:hypothetical protein